MVLSTLFFFYLSFAANELVQMKAALGVWRVGLARTAFVQCI